MRKRTQLSILLANKPGELAKISKALARAKVNIEALAVNDGIHHGVVKMVVDRPDAARKALRAARHQFTEEKVFALPLPNLPGTLAEMTGKLARLGLNIDYVYGSTCGVDCDCGCVLILSVADAKKAESLLVK